MKKYIRITIKIFIIIQLIDGSILFTKNSSAPDEIQDSIASQKHLDPDNSTAAPVHQDKKHQVTIYYGLNDSHSRNWAQVNSDGVTGIAYFKRNDNSENEGVLFYQTIQPDGSVNIDSVITGTRLEKSVLLFDSLAMPHIFVAQSTNSDQIIDHYFQNHAGQWQIENIIHFFNEGGKFIYELSADTGPDDSFHLLILKTRSNIDSDDFNWAWLDSYLYHMTNETGTWQKELIRNYNMAYTYDLYIKSSSRQDIKIDKNGNLHVIFSEQINAENDPSRLWYATNKTGDWMFELALNHDYGIRDDAGWFPSLYLDNNEIPHISCMYVNRVYTYSARYAKLFLLKRVATNNWQKTIIADHDDGYYGSDGRNYTGGLSHLIFDKNNTPHILFSDIASTHWPHPENQCWNMGNIRYGIFANKVWNIRTIYRQPLPTRFFIATEMVGMCLIVSEITNTIHVIGQEMVITGDNQYSCDLLNFSWEKTNIEKDNSVYNFKLQQNYPNPFNSTTTIQYELPQSAKVNISIYNTLGEKVNVLENKFHHSGPYVLKWDGTDQFGKSLANGIYICQMQAGQFNKSLKLILMK